VPKKKGSKFAFKLLLVGEPEVGKTSLINDQEQELIYQIWDVAGQSGFTNFRHLYLKKAHGVFLVFDLTRLDTTFEKLNRWREDVQEQSPNAKIIVIGNKEDLVDQENPPISEKEVLEKLEAHGYITTSAKTGSKVEGAFIQMGKLILGK